MNCWHRKKLHSTLYYLHWRRKKGMGNFTMIIPKINYIWLWSKERKAHTHTHTPSHAQPCHSLISATESREDRTAAGKRLRSHQQITESWWGLNHFQSTLHIRGHINTSDFKSKWFCWYHLWYPFTVRKKHVTGIKVQNIHTTNVCIAVAINNTQPKYAALYFITHKYLDIM